LAAAVIGVAVSLVAQLFLAFVDAGPDVAAGVGILAGIFIAGRRLRVHGVGPWIGVALAVITLQVVLGLSVIVALGL
jgi:hypothetical protein